MTSLVLAVLGVAFAAFFVRLLAGPSLADRVLAVDGLLICGIAAVVTRAVHNGEGAFLPVAVVLTLVGFIGTATIARFIERQGR